jgi:predicted nucleic acid-binding protein
VNAVDSSVVVAGFSSWHEQHDVARRAIAEQPHLPEHVAAEAYSVLTRLPNPYRAEPPLVHEFLVRAFEDRILDVRPQDVMDLLGELADHGIAGGAAYDGLIALSVKRLDATLLTLDRRARETYDRLGVRVRFL